jgi:hypothetical protein
LKASELPSQVKEKIALERSFGVKHGVQLLRLKGVWRKILVRFIFGCGVIFGYETTEETFSLGIV